MTGATGGWRQRTSANVARNGGVVKESSIVNTRSENEGAGVRFPSGGGSGIKQAQKDALRALLLGLKPEASGRPAVKAECPQPQQQPHWIQPDEDVRGQRWADVEDPWWMHEDSGGQKNLRPAAASEVSEAGEAASGKLLAGRRQLGPRGGRKPKFPTAADSLTTTTATARGPDFDACSTRRSRTGRG
mmetsp:Transcript_59396/g.156359  ORF Transcript_59396/g.156359 Transcript_59396/m.156359 type:complete len:188 (-) Transcript_59396:283-846(-)